MQEKLSAMMDGEWNDQDIDRLIASLNEDEDCASCWREFHLISDAMRERPALSPDFMSRFSDRLDAEPIVVAPGAMRRKQQPVRRRWVAMSMAASIVIVGATAWYVTRSANSQQMAAPYVAVNQPAAQDEADVSPYLVAHQDVLGNPGFAHRAVILTEAEAEKPTVH
ncbi:MAG: sigma-E factor negative regulatory protein [Burkholderiales bacterium]|nr:sigma-E factor negative regulatory protein [Burkholderiales bacterium]